MFMLKMSLRLCVVAVGLVTALPALATAREIAAIAAPALGFVSAMNEPGSLLVLGSVLAGLAYLIDGRQGRS